MLRECSSSSEEEGEEEEEEEEEEEYLCLFCEHALSSSRLLLEHSSQEHGVDLVAVLAPRPFHDVIKILNYVRSEKTPAQDMQQVAALSLSEDYLKPVVADDPVLMIDFAELGAAPPPEGNSQNDAVRQLELLTARFQKMQLAYMALLEHSTQNNQSAGRDGYFDSYADYSIHAEMLQDTVRTNAYRDFVYNNPALFKDRDVLDVGCGTGILSLFCARSGARSVTAVDNSEIAEKAGLIVRRSGLGALIKVVRAPVEEVLLEDKVHVIISEWMGYGLLFECMLDSVLAARDAHLAPGGTMVPNRASLFLAGLSNIQGYTKRFHYWRDVYGFNMEDVIPDLHGQAVVEEVEAGHVVSQPCGFKHLDLNTVSSPELEFTSQFELQIRRRSPLTGLCLHFTCYFDGAVSVVLETAPETPSTHWLQTVLYLAEVVPVEAGDIVRGHVEFVKSRQVKRGYVIKVKGAVVREGAHLADIDQTFLLN